ncbi:MAG: NAD-dependent DNA ligase LigA, partial [Phycisphaerae bacterium]
MTAASLRTTVMKHDRQYHAGRPTIPDAEYDRLYSQLRTMEGRAAPPDSPTRTVGERPVRGRRKVRHMVPMLSLESARDFDIVRAFG